MRTERCQFRYFVGWTVALLIGQGALLTADAQRDTSGTSALRDSAAAAVQLTTASQAVAAGIKLLGVMDANTGDWIDRATVRDTLGNETSTSRIGVVALNVLAPVMGFYMIEVRKAGYAPQRFKLKADTAAEFLVALMPNPLGTATALPAVITTEKRLNLNYDPGLEEGFFARCATNEVGCVGRKELDVRPTEPIGMLLKQKSGVTVTCPYAWTCHTQMLSKLPTGPRDQFCDPTFFVDGMMWANGQGELDKLLNAPTIAGMEVYLSGMPTPARFSIPGSNCGAIVIWTRGRP